MSFRWITLFARPLSVALVLLAGCSHGSDGLFRSEIRRLSDDVIDLMTTVFQTAENAFVGDSVEPEDIVDPAGAGNDFTVTYDLPLDDRVGLGLGFGRVGLRIEEDGVPVADPLAFSFGTTTALEVVLIYELRYDGEAELTGRNSDIDLTVTVTATRTSPAFAFLNVYFVDGIADFGATFCDITARFRSPGRPRDGIDVDFGDGEGRIDNPNVVDEFDLDLDFFDEDFFRAEGDVGICCFFERTFAYEDVF